MTSESIAQPRLLAQTLLSLPSLSSQPLHSDVSRCSTTSASEVFSTFLPKPNSPSPLLNFCPCHTILPGLPFTIRVCFLLHSLPLTLTLNHSPTLLHFPSKVFSKSVPSFLFPGLPAWPMSLLEAVSSLGTGTGFIHPRVPRT